MESKLSYIQQIMDRKPMKLQHFKIQLDKYKNLILKNYKVKYKH